ncbi:MAG TPA: serine hydrolase domain-containing protein, partial [Holophaga sp.]|nr:serine hydrolase domain-containing protein [Holophaga sp.]
MPFAPLPPSPPAMIVPAAVPLETALQRELEAVVADYGIPGASLAMRLRDGRMIRLAAGWADREARRPMTPDHQIFTGSIGKTLVAALVLRQVQVGRLDLD